jgi:hypothetical protein
MNCCNCWLPWKFCLSGCCLDTVLLKRYFGSDLVTCGRISWKVPTSVLQHCSKTWTFRRMAEIKVRLSLCFLKYHNMGTYVGVPVQIHIFINTVLLGHDFASPAQPEWTLLNNVAKQSYCPPQIEKPFPRSPTSWTIVTLLPTRHQDILIDWPSVVTWLRFLTLTLTWLWTGPSYSWTLYIQGPVLPGRGSVRIRPQ